MPLLLSILTYIRSYNAAVTMPEITSPALSRHTTCTHHTTYTVWLALPLPLATLLTNAEVCVDACVACGACQVLVLPVRYVLVGACITVLLCQSKVNDVDQVALLAKAHEEVVGLHITVDEVLQVNELNLTDLGQERWEWGRRWSEVGFRRWRWGLREVKRSLGRSRGGVARDKKRFKRGGGRAWS